ncbi:MAG TPA: hypothetical protein VJ227_05050, partial [Patescibacteria group bacterium]|nr:hypothetical protein [Patescibacteria group bacterium]
TPAPSKKPTPKPTPTSEVLGLESSPESATPQVPQSPNPEVTPEPKNKPPLVAFAFILAGAVLIALSIFLAVRKTKESSDTISE